MNDSCIMVFTSRSVEQLIKEGGSQAWKMNLANSKKYRYLVCTWNPSGEHAPSGRYLERGEGFLVAPISSIEQATLPTDADKFIIRFTEYAAISTSNCWNGQRNPFTYSSLSELGIDISKLTFQPRPSTADLQKSKNAHAGSATVRPLSIYAAKQGLALHYDVDPQSIEIMIRG